MTILETRVFRMADGLKQFIAEDIGEKGELIPAEDSFAGATLRCAARPWIGPVSCTGSGRTGFQFGCSEELRGGKMRLGSKGLRRQGNAGLEGKGHGD